MSRISSFINKVNQAQEARKVTFKEQQRTEFITKAKEELHQLETEGGIFHEDEDKVCNYAVEKFTNYYLQAKRSYTEFINKQQEEKDNKIKQKSEEELLLAFKELMTNSFIAIYTCKDKSNPLFGCLKFSRLHFKQLYSFIDNKKIKKEFPKVEESKLESNFYKNKYIHNHLNEFKSKAGKLLSNSFTYSKADQECEFVMLKDNQLPCSFDDDWTQLCESLSLQFL